MNQIAQQREKTRQLKALLNVAEPYERPEIKRMIRKNQIRLALLLLQKDFETAVDGSFNPEISRKIDAVEFLLRS